MYKIILPNFEGPLDLMLYFIKKDELNIYDIPIAKITSEFLNYIRIIRLFDLELAGEFLVMASTLMYIKTQMLLPKQVDEDGTEPEDPRTQLVERLIEYRLFKSAATNLGNLAEEQKYIFYRNLFNADNKLISSEQDNQYKNATIFDLLKAFKIVLDRANKKPESHIVAIVSITLEEKTDFILKTLSRNPRISFFELTKNDNKQHLVVTFLALLELIKSRLIFIVQSEVFDDIIIANKPNQEDGSGNN